MELLKTLKKDFASKSLLASALQKDNAPISNYSEACEQNLDYAKYYYAYKDCNKEYIVVDIDDGELFDKEKQLKDELFEACEYIVFKGLDGKGFAKYHFFFKDNTSFKQTRITKLAIDIFCKSNRLFFSHPSLNQIQFETDNAPRDIYAVKGSFDKTSDMPKSLQNTLAKYMSSEALFKETKLTGLTQKRTQYTSSCNIDTFLQLTNRLTKQKPLPQALIKKVNSILFTDENSSNYRAFTFEHEHEIEDGAGKRNDFICKDLITKLLYDPSIPKDYDEKSSQFLTIVCAIADSKYVNFFASGHTLQEIKSAIKSLVKNITSFEIFYDAYWETTKASFDEVIKNHLSNSFINDLEALKKECGGYLPLKRIDSVKGGGNTKYYLYNSAMKVDIVGGAYGENANPKLMTFKNLQSEFKRLTGLTLEESMLSQVEFKFNMQRHERFYYENVLDNLDDGIDESELTEAQIQSSRRLIFNLFNETRAMRTFRLLDRNTLEGSKCPLFIDNLLTHLVSRSYLANSPDYESNIKKAKNFILHSLAYKLETKKRGHFCYTFRGFGGTGKSLFTSVVLKKIFEQYHTQIRMKDIANNFNAELENKLVVLLDESDKTNPKALNLFMKQIVANNMLTIEKKGRDRYEALNYTSFFMNTNEEESLMDKTSLDRREVEFQCASTRLVDVPYFKSLLIKHKETSFENAIAKEMDECMDAFIRYLKSLDIDMELITNQLITTSAKEALKDAYTPEGALIALLTENELCKNTIEAFAEDAFANAPPELLKCPDDVDEIIASFRQDGLIFDDNKMICNHKMLKAILPKAFHQYLHSTMKKLTSSYIAKKQSNTLVHFISKKTLSLIDEKFKGLAGPPKSCGGRVIKADSIVVNEYHLRLARLFLINFSEKEEIEYQRGKERLLNKRDLKT